MPKIAASAILGDFQRMLDEHWKYTAGAAEAGNDDCSGAFVWSYRQHGQSIYHAATASRGRKLLSLSRFLPQSPEWLFSSAGIRVIRGMPCRLATNRAANTTTAT